VDTEAILHEILGGLRLHHVQLDIHDMPRVKGDRVAMQQIFGNLLDNAVKYLDPARPGRIEIWTTIQEEEAIFHIRDNGRGIAPGDYEKVLQPFRRARNAFDVEGSGMGLAYVQTLIRRLGGRIWFESQPDVGTTFHVSLPIAPDNFLSNLADTQPVRPTQSLLQPGA
jgi:signal transduction histidine kinase